MNNIIKMYIDKLTKDDIKSYISKNNYNVSDNDINTIYFYIKNYTDEFFNNPDIILNKIKRDISNSTYIIIINLYNKYKSYIKRT